MTAVIFAPGLPVSPSPESHSTFSDPRSAQPSSPESFGSSSTTLHHPDLSTDEAALSNKLIHAINQQTYLDDTLSATRHELEASQGRVRQLEAALQEYKTRDLMGSGVLRRTMEVEDNTVELREKLADEKKRRDVVEKDKKGIEQELETLTTALFEEANLMVAKARQEREAAEKRSERMQIQLLDTQQLLASLQEQLAELKGVMQQASDDPDIFTNASTAPSSPSLQTNESMSKIFDALHLTPNTPGGDDIPPAPPTSFTHLLHPVLRSDLPAYDDFRSLIQTPPKSSPTSRRTTGSYGYGGLNVAGLGSALNRELSQLSGYQQSNGTISSMSTYVYPSSPKSNNSSPSASTNSSFSSRDTSVSAISLKETRFYKRTLTEDIEPTLRLDTAPGLSWRARRTVVNSMCDGNLVVEPMPLASTHSAFSCSLCGNNKPGDEHTRTHRFRTSDDDNAQRYPLCSYCLNRVRSSCDFLAFLRMVKDGHWRVDGPEAEAQVWEESVRLREAMFWARIGGGVIPSFVRARDSPRRTSVEEEKKPSSSDSPAPDTDRIQTTTPGTGLGVVLSKEADGVNSGDQPKTGPAVSTLNRPSTPPHQIGQ